MYTLDCVLAEVNRFRTDLLPVLVFTGAFVLWFVSAMYFKQGWFLDWVRRVVKDFRSGSYSARQRRPGREREGSSESDTEL